MNPAPPVSLRARALHRGLGPLTPIMTGTIPVNAHTLPAMRAVIDHVMRAAAPVLRGSIIEPVTNGPVRGEWVIGPRVHRRDAAVLYVHGGGFVAGSPHGYRGLTSRLSTVTRLPVFAVDYRLAPEHPYPAAVHDVATAYAALRDRGLSAEQIVLAGDSAGGYLAADLAFTHAAHGRTSAAAMVLLAPMTDLTLRTARQAAHHDPLLSAAVASAAVTQFTDQPLQLRPPHGAPLPPTLIHASDEEFFAADAIELAARLHTAGAQCRLHTWSRQIHVFHALPAFIPECRAAYRAIGRFVTGRLEHIAA
ncbi:alpha/beta hydrolase [Nocardia sp. MDA0666]|uniref:alpha/beta hydrolase n=1 Tax=Nocardia sp. MDA0666 TaxID=2135448 RepID=UPI000D407AA4|nr:alpha/beta hydrolase fold domain-containing protein [Nocardia sp. MDA0666]PSR65748.1 alpha/beta hydrolase [Nocardia sp. MDA0666]